MNNGYCRTVALAGDETFRHLGRHVKDDACICPSPVTEHHLQSAQLSPCQNLLPGLVDHDDSEYQGPIRRGGEAPFQSFAISE